MLTRRALAVVPVTNNDPLDTVLLVITGNVGDSTIFAGKGVLDLVGLAVLSVDGTNQHVVGDVVQMSTVLQPRTGHGDVVSGGLALGLDKDGQVGGILAVPGLERLEELQTVGSGRDSDVDGCTVLGRVLVGILTWVVAVGREAITGWLLELELLAIGIGELINERVEVEGSGNGHGNDKVGRGDERVGGRVSIVTASEVTVVRGDDGVGSSLLDILAVPLTNARSAGVGKDHAAKLLKGLELSIALNGSTNLLRSWGNGEEGLGLEAVGHGILRDRGRAGHVLVRRVGARADQTDLELFRPLVGLDSLLELADGGGKIGGEGTVDVGLKLREVNLDKLVVLGTLILAKLLSIFAGEVTNGLALGGIEVVVHAVIEGEHRGGGTNFG